MVCCTKAGCQLVRAQLLALERSVPKDTMGRVNYYMLGQVGAAGRLVRQLVRWLVSQVVATSPMPYGQACTCPLCVTPLSTWRSVE